MLATVVTVLPYPLQAFEGGSCTALTETFIEAEVLGVDGRGPVSGFKSGDSSQCMQAQAPHLQGNSEHSSVPQSTEVQSTLRSVFGRPGECHGQLCGTAARARRRHWSIPSLAVWSLTHPTIASQLRVAKPELGKLLIKSSIQLVYVALGEMVDQS